MSVLFADGIIYLLLLIGIGFSGIGVIGLFLFPDIRSRRFTGFRASLIGVSAAGCAVILYGAFLFLTLGGGQYLTLVSHALILVFVVFAGTMLVSREVLNRAVQKNSCGIPDLKSED